MRKTALFCALVFALGGAAVAYASGSGSRTARTTQIHLREQATGASYVHPFTTKGTSRGDYVAFFDPLADAASKAPMGHVQGVCTLVNVAQLLFSCNVVTFQLPGGTLYSGGLFSGKGLSIADPIFGGTGRYAGASGMITGRALSQTTDDWVIAVTS
jgi:hypothetical protein